MQFESLQDRGQNQPHGLETFDLKKSVVGVSLSSDEMTAVCPITGQPDYYKVEVDITGSTKGIESKSFKLYLQGFRNHGAFCEALADQILRDLVTVLDGPYAVNVVLIQKPRGGISIRAESRWDGVVGYGLGGEASDRPVQEGFLGSTPSSKR